MRRFRTNVICLASHGRRATRSGPVPFNWIAGERRLVQVALHEHDNKMAETHVGTCISSRPRARQAVGQSALTLRARRATTRRLKATACEGTTRTAERMPDIFWPSTFPHPGPMYSIWPLPI